MKKTPFFFPSLFFGLLLLCSSVSPTFAKKDIKCAKMSWTPEKVEILGTPHAMLAKYKASYKTSSNLANRRVFLYSIQQEKKVYLGYVENKGSSWLKKQWELNLSTFQAFEQEMTNELLKAGGRKCAGQIAANLLKKLQKSPKEVSFKSIEMDQLLLQKNVSYTMFGRFALWLLC